MTYTTMNFDTYQMICDLLWDYPDMDLADIAQMAGLPLAMVQYVDRAESNIF